jgi:hypothetical protein
VPNLNDAQFSEQIRSRSETLRSGELLNQVVVEGLMVIAAGRAYAASRPPVLARPRRGSRDLPDRDAPDRSPPEAPAETEVAEVGDRWIVPASVGLAAMLGTVVARAATLI